jgi:hypothetical protein
VSDKADVTYHVYGRTQYEQPLEFVRKVTVAQDEKPPVPGGQDWLELIAFPEAAVVRVLPRGKERAE